MGDRSTFRILHTSDWHLGHRLDVFERESEHAAFLAWLLAVLEAECVHALVVAGDLFDSAHPPASASHQLHAFLRQARSRLPHLDIVLVAGNHDSAARLDALTPLLEGTGIHLVGGLPIGEEDQARLVVPLHGGSDSVRAWIAAIPFLRPSDLPPSATTEGGGALVGGVAGIYDRALSTALSRRLLGQALVAIGHAYMVGGEASELSERRIWLGHEHALPVSLFSTEWDYVALGHLHRPQNVGGYEHIRYSGSPIPLSMAEIDYPHQVRIVDFEAGRFVATRPVLVPRSVPLIRWPDRGASDPDSVLSLCRGLPPGQGIPVDARPFLEICVQLAEPRPRLKEEIHEALRDRAVRLVRVQIVRGTAADSAPELSTPRLADVQPLHVLREAWREQGYEGDLPLPLQSLFAELFDEAGRSLSAPAEDRHP